MLYLDKYHGFWKCTLVDIDIPWNTIINHDIPQELICIISTKSIIPNESVIKLASNIR